MVPRQIDPPLGIGVHRLILICDKILASRSCRRIIAGAETRPRSVHRDVFELWIQSGINRPVLTQGP
jgi:hypothetical protein